MYICEHLDIYIRVTSKSPHTSGSKLTCEGCNLKKVDLFLRFCHPVFQYSPGLNPLQKRTRKISSDYNGKLFSEVRDNNTTMDPNYSAQKMDGETKNDLQSMPCFYLQVDINLSQQKNHPNPWFSRNPGLVQRAF